MAPRRAHADHSNSESDSKNSDPHNNPATGTTSTTTSRASAKARSLLLQQSQKEFLLKHINSNGPQDHRPIDPLDFESLSNHELRNYSNFYLNDSAAANNGNLGRPSVKTCLTLNGYLLESKVGEKTYSYIHKNRVLKPELAAVVKKHFNTLNVKESEVITNFIYKVNNQDKAFKLRFTNNTQQSGER